MLTGWLSRSYVRVGGLAMGCVSALLMVVVGCTSVTDGSATVDGADAPAYRQSVSASVEASAATSSARESERQDSVTTEAMHSVCESLSTTGADAITAINAYVDVFNGGGSQSDIDAEASAAVDALNRSAELVTSGVTGAVPPELEQALTEWVDAAKALAIAISGDAPTEIFNAAIDRVNSSKSRALTLCDATY